MGERRLSGHENREAEITADPRKAVKCISILLYRFVVVAEEVRPA